MGKEYGFTDEAAAKDEFGIIDYINGLSQFIAQCNTPLTMSIQGTWGTGKTSIMNLVKKELPASIVPIWFNTWQFSQFNMDNQLAVSLLANLIAEFDIEDTEVVQKTNKLLTGLRIFGGITKDLALAYADAKFGLDLSGVADNAVQKKEEDTAQDFIDPTATIRNLREQFALCVAKTLEEKKKDRIVVFIDDLDRLEPRKAVELLEVLKIFLDCKDCVFVLAIDYDVVCRGVAAKYGTLADDPKEANEKGKSFFDKIIQVPFKMPVARYNISGYVENCFKQIGVVLNKEKELPVYVDLIKRSIGTNPRSMKRLFNSYQLLKIVVPDELLNETKNQQLLFATLCLQYCSEPIYNYLMRNADALTTDIFDYIVKGNYKAFSSTVEDTDDIIEDDLASAQPFMEKFSEVVDTDGKNGIDSKELDNFRKVLSFSAITATSETCPISTVRDQSYYWFGEGKYKKSRLVQAVIIKYVKDKENANIMLTYNDLVKVFPDDIQSGSYRVVKLLSELTDNEKGANGNPKRYYVDEPIVLPSKEEVVVCTQWTVTKIEEFIRAAEKAGYEIRKS